MILYCTDGDSYFALAGPDVFKLEDDEWSPLPCSTEMFERFNPSLERIDPALVPSLIQKVEVQKAEPIKGFTSFKDKTNESMQLIATLHASRLSNWGFIGEADMLGQTTYKLNAMLDNRTSEFCRMINGRTFTLDQARGLVDRSIFADNPADLRQIQPWPNQSKASIAELKGLSNEDLAARGFHVPPFHPGCRTMMTRVDTPAPLGKQTPKSQEIPASVSTAGSFDQLGLKLTDGQIKVWNDYVGMDPSVVLQTLTGQSVLDVLENTGWSKNMGWSLKVMASGNVKVGWAKNMTTLNPLTNSLTFKNTAMGDALAYSKVKVQVGSYAKALGVQKVTLRVNPGDALDAIESGFVPGPVEWQSVKAAMKVKIAGPSNVEYLKLSASEKVSVFTILNSNLETDMLDLATLPRAFVKELVSDLKYSGSLYL